MLILIPVLIAALDTQNIPAVFTPGRDILTIVLNKLPYIFAASIIIIVAIVIGKIIQPLLTQILVGLGFDRFLDGLGIKKIG